MDRSVILALYDREQRIDIEYPGLTKEIGGGVVRFTGPPNHESGNFILYSRFADENADSVISEQISHFRAQQQPFEWKVYEHDSPPDLRARLVIQGFKPRGRDIVMVLNVRDAQPRLLRPPHLDVQRLTDAAQLQELTSLLYRVYGVDFNYLERLLGDDLRDRPYFSSIYTAYVGHELAGVGWIQFPARSQFASLWGGTVLPAYRGRGIYRALLAVRHQEAIRRGYSLITIEAPKSCRGLAEKFGFQMLTYSHSCLWQPRG
ncbi:MAG: GNAT family N-acetyltransferase [Candidatus Promineifilaceae bacterium]|jgi:GNAT superfamily N-acetyltransferase